ncbi:2-ketoisovalerate ferredoxin oxidoreductase subunit alpha [Holophaga foetida]|uniref:2-ketoisovalerate ferredoxin oxidoreductase subunit alpha n=1 Tax=Holophaga foetida TaxID=35839 RepID=UPI0002472666|nr:2-ketoisovalerate ferredoxin oxidoreductase subunit alpha [Holophaga foetida]
MTKMVAATGNEAIANAMRLAKVDVCSAYPITPATEIMQRFTSFAANGKVQTEVLLAESEHSAMSGCIGASAAGGRVATATSSQGLALMWEMLLVASGQRLPIVMAVCNRALAAPTNIGCDHSDSMGTRDCGWIQLYSETGQEAFDNMLMAFRIAENMDIRMPVMVCQDGFITSHSIANVQWVEENAAATFVGDYRQSNPLLDLKRPVSYGQLALSDLYMEYRKAHDHTMSLVPQVVREVAAEFKEISGRSYDLFESYRLDDAEIGIVVMSSAAGTTKDIIDRYRDKGIKAGLLKPRLYRPFPYEDVAQALKHLKALAVLDRADSFGASFGPLFLDIAGALSACNERPIMINKIFGLGGRDYMPEQGEHVLDELIQIAKGAPVKAAKEYIGVRG